MYSFALELIIILLCNTYNRCCQECIRESTQQHTQSIALRCARVASLVLICNSGNFVSKKFRPLKFSY